MGIAVVRLFFLFLFFFPRNKKYPADSPECFPLFAELQGREAAVGLLVEHPAPSSLQQRPAHLHAAPLGSHVKRRRPLLVDCIYSTSLTETKTSS